jgi:hypothetical protein
MCVLNDLKRPEALTPPHESARLLAEIGRLRKRVDQQEHSLTVLSQAVSVLRDGSRALRQENRDLRLQLHKKGPVQEVARRRPARVEAG